MFVVYILRSESSGKTYIGQTDNLGRRLSEHNDPAQNRNKFTSKNKGPWKLIHSEEFETRSDAMRREKWLKTGVGRDWIKQNLDVWVERSAAAD